MTASEGLFDGRGQRVVIGVEDEDSEQLCRLGLARVLFHRTVTQRRRLFAPLVVFQAQPDPIEFPMRSAIGTSCF